MLLDSRPCGDDADKDELSCKNASVLSSSQSSCCSKPPPPSSCGGGGSVSFPCAAPNSAAGACRTAEPAVVAVVRELVMKGCSEGAEPLLLVITCGCCRRKALTKFIRGGGGGDVGRWIATATSFTRTTATTSATTTMPSESGPRGCTLLLVVRRSCLCRCCCSWSNAAMFCCLSVWFSVRCELERGIIVESSYMGSGDGFYCNKNAQ
jgi:hypothetical protein